MIRLPLDYSYIYSAWEQLAGQLHHQDSLYSARVSDNVWNQKLRLIQNIIDNNPDTASCTGCGQCCLDFPFACRAVEFLHLLPYLAKSWTPWQQRAFFEDRLGVLNPDGKNRCPFLEESSCSVYPVRPLLCRRAVCGDHICNHRTLDFESFGDWCGHSAVIKQMTIMNIVYFDLNTSPPEEMGWSADLNPVGGPGKVSLTIAPFEIWLLLLLGENIQSLINNPGYKPLISWKPHPSTKNSHF